MTDFVKTRAGIKMPPIIYGTAWKKERTAELVALAIQIGFRGIDTAAQPKHYDEARVGEGLQIAYKNVPIQRDELFIQTKFSPLVAQDPETVPYDPNAAFLDQVSQSLEVSLKNLHTEILDSWVLHSPLENMQQTFEVWKAMESKVESGQVKQLGISNCYDLEFFKTLFEEAKIKPAVLQNRFFSKTNYDKDLRHFCSKNQIYYQSFWTLTANPHILESATLVSVAQTHRKTPAQILFRYLMDQQIVPLTGTTSEVHMKEDLEALDIKLSSDEEESLTKLF